MENGSEGSVLLDFVDQFLEDREAGSVRPLDHYLARFPGHREEVRREYERLAAAARDGGDEAPAAGAPVGSAPVRIGPYRLIRQLGRGGQGTVFLAEDTRIDRQVALKVLTSLFSAVPEARLRRFRREAEVISRLDHPGICGVFEADLEGETPYLAMRFIEGETLAERITRARRAADGEEPGPRARPAPETPHPVAAPRDAADLRRTLQFFEAAARALQSAHEAGIVHRDIKPGNLMITPAGDPVILDFGLAHDEGSEAPTLTQSGELFGTPAYMSPEQIDGRGKLGPRTDVYALGVVLYEFLTLHRPFEAPSRAALYKAISTSAAPSCRSHNASLPIDVEVVLETALERDPRRRYPSARELADDLQRVRRLEPIHARPAGPGLRLKRWMQRHPVLATGSLTTLALLVTGLIVSLLALRERTIANRELSAINLGARSLLMTDEDPTLALLLAIASVETDDNYYGNMALYAALAACREQTTLMEHDDRLTDVDVDDASQRVVTASLDGTAIVWDLRSGRRIERLEGHGSDLSAASFLPGGERVVTASMDGTARVHTLGRPQEVLVLEGHTGWVRAAEPAPDGRLIATASNDRTARLWDAESGDCLAVLEGHRGVVTTARFSPDGRRLLTASGEPTLWLHATTEGSDGTARLFDVESGASVAVLGPHGTHWIMDAQFSPDGRRVATASMDGTARIWDAETGDELRTLRLGDFAYSATWSPSGNELVTTHAEGADLWDATTWTRTVLVGHMSRPARSAAFSPDGSRFVTGSTDKTAIVWETADPVPERAVTLARAGSPISECVWAPDGSRIVTCTEGKWAHIWYPNQPPGVAALEGHTGPVNTIAFSPDGTRVVTASDDGTARLWTDLESGRADGVLLGHTAAVRSAAFSPDATRVVTASNDLTVRLWDAVSGAELHVLHGHSDRVRSAEFSPDGAVVLSFSTDFSGRLWDARTGAVLHVLGDHRGQIMCADFSPDGTLLATGARDRSTRVWDVETGRTLWLFDEFDPPPEASDRDAVTSVAFSPDGRWVASACDDDRIRIWDVENGELVARIEDVLRPGFVSFSPDGERLLVAQRKSGIVVTWRVGGTARALSMGADSKRAHTLAVTTASYSPDGRLVLSASRDATARLWYADTGVAIAILDGHSEEVADARFGPRGRWVATASRDGTARLWPVDPLAVAVRRKPREMTPDQRARYRGH